jgi:hypothetical protein
MENEKKLTFENPDVFTKDPSTGMQKIDREASEQCILLEALGTPKVFYAAKANKYYRDAKFTNEFSNDELQKLGLPIPVEIEATRKRLMKAAIEAGKAPDMAAILSATSPKVLDYPEAIKSKIAVVDPMERMINRVNRSTLGK